MCWCGETVDIVSKKSVGERSTAAADTKYGPYRRAINAKVTVRGSVSTLFLIVRWFGVRLEFIQVPFARVLAAAAGAESYSLKLMRFSGK